MNVKILYLFALFCMSAFVIKAQDETIMSRFNRPTVSNIILKFKDDNKEEDNVGSVLAYIPASNKINLSNTGKNTIQFNTLGKEGFGQLLSKPVKVSMKDKVRNVLLSKANFYEAEQELGPQLAELLKKNGAAGDMFAEWAKKDKNGKYTTIAKRTQQNITASDIKRNTDADKVAFFEDLVKNNFIFVYHLPKVLSPDEEPQSGRVAVRNSGESTTLLSLVNVFIFKVNVPDDMFNKVVKPAFDSPQKLKNIDYPLEYVGYAAIKSKIQPKVLWESAALVGQLYADDENEGVNFKTGKPVKNKSVYDIPVYKAADGLKLRRSWDDLTIDEQEKFLYSHLMSTIMDEVINLAEINLEEFKVKAPIVQANPIKAPVGIREGVKADKRFRVYENVFRKGEVQTKSVGLVRTKPNVVNNVHTQIDTTTGHPLMSEFKQTYGGVIREDMYLVQDTDYGLGLSAGFRFGYFGEVYLPSTLFNLRANYNISNTINNMIGKSRMYGMHAYFGLAYGIKGTDEMFNGRKLRVNVLDLQLGIEKRLYLNPKYDLIPELGFSFLLPFAGGVSNQTIEAVGFFNIGMRGAIWVAEGIAVQPGINIPMQFTANRHKPASFMHFEVSTRFDF